MLGQPLNQIGCFADINFCRVLVADEDVNEMHVSYGSATLRPYRRSFAGTFLLRAVENLFLRSAEFNYSAK